MADDDIVNYRGCKILAGPDHRGRRQLWVSIPGHTGVQRFACHTVEDGKAAIDAHFASQTGQGERKISSVVSAVIAGVILVALLLALAATKQG